MPNKVYDTHVGKLMNYNLRQPKTIRSNSQIIVIQIHYLSFLKTELHLAGRWQ